MKIYADHPNAERILQDGWELFQQKGYRGVSVDELCQRCQITNPTLYYYFKDKKNLFIEVLLHRLHGFREVIEKSGSLSQRLERIAVTIFDSFKTDYSHLVHDLEHFKQQGNITRVHQAFDDELFSPVTTLMQSAVEEGDIQGDAKFLAHLFMGIVKNDISRSGEFGAVIKSLQKNWWSFF